MNRSSLSTNKNKENGDEKGFPPVRDRSFWEGRAAEFAEYAASTGYAEGFLKVMDIRRGWTVLDMACGGGVLAIPLAPRVKSVTAVDFSKNMLEIVNRRCQENGITNVTSIQGRWEDDWHSLGIGIYDVAIASRSLIGEDSSVMIAKLDKAARNRVYISANVGDGPFDRRAYEATGRKLEAGPGYKPIYYDIICGQMGIPANIAFIREDHRTEWNSLEEALDGQRWMFHELAGEEERRLKVYLDSCLVRVGSRLRLPYERQCEWAVMWWEK